MADNRIPLRTENAVDAEVDGELVLLSPRDFSYFGASETGSVVWNLIDGRRTVDEIVADLELRYSDESGAIRRETVGFLGVLSEAGLIRPFAVTD